MAKLIPTAIVLHCSASKWGDAAEIDAWHKERGFQSDGYHIGYHYVVLNGYRSCKLAYLAADDGLVEKGRPDDLVGAHCKDMAMNFKALGVCLIGMPGVPGYAGSQQQNATVELLVRLCTEHGIAVEAISQHSEWDKDKPYCASLNMASVREAVRRRMPTAMGRRAQVAVKIGKTAKPAIDGSLMGSVIYLPVRKACQQLGQPEECLGYDQGKKQALLNGKALTTLLIGGLSWCPASEIARALGATWNAEGRGIIIKK